jgi:hypothetical protein
VLLSAGAFISRCNFLLLSRPTVRRVRGSCPGRQPEGGAGKRTKREKKTAKSKKKEKTKEKRENFVKKLALFVIVYQEKVALVRTLVTISNNTFFFFFVYFLLSLRGASSTIFTIHMNVSQKRCLF